MAQKAWKKIKHNSWETWLFLKSKIFLKNFAGMVSLIAFMMFCSFWLLKCYTKHGESLQVDNYVGLDLDDVVRKANDRSFDIVVSDSLYIRKQPPGTVLSQNPAPFSRVKENRKIYLTITKKDAPLLKLPDIVGGNDDFQTYARKLKRMKFIPKITGRVFDAKLESNTIKEVIYKGDTITNQLRDGVFAEAETEIHFIVSEKRGGSVDLPNLLCQRYDAAQFLIGNYNLNVGSVIEDETVTDRFNAFVWRQRPSFSPGKKIRIGEQVNLYLTQHRPDDCTGAGGIEGGFGEIEDNEEF